MRKEPDRARIQLSWTRRQWRKILAVIEDHPKTALVAAGLLIGFVLFYGLRLEGFGHFRESGARWRLQTFGGSHQVDRSVRVPDVVLSFEAFQYDRLDLTTPTAAHLGGTAFRKELREIANEDGGMIRINALDPRLSDREHQQHERFALLAEAFGMETWELSARCWYSAAVLIHLKQELGDAIEVRFFSRPSPDAKEPFFVIGRSGHAYDADDPKQRLDVIVPRPAKPTGSDSFTHPGMIIRNRPDNAAVIRFTKAFDSLWESATPLDAQLHNQILEKLSGQNTPGS